MILKRLRSETHDVHARLEARLPLMNPGLSLESYRDLLERFHGYYVPLEEVLYASPVWQQISFDYSERRKAVNLEKDLRALGLEEADIAGLPRCADLPPVDSLPRVLGCLYVVEGATLGGQVITRRLQTHLGITPGTGGAFFAGYGVATGEKWKSFCEMITDAERFGGADETVASARRTFETLENWLLVAAPAQ